MPQECADILIVGGGIAGLAAAAHLAPACRGRLVLAEREPRPGFYASGHNAGIARRLTGRPEHTALAAAGRDLLAAVPGLLRVTGGLLLGAEPGATRALAEEARAFGLAAQLRPGPPRPGLRAAESLHLPGDGVLDIQAVLAHCAGAARAAGARLRFGCAVRAVAPDAGGFRVETDRGVLAAGLLVNAAGAWAGSLGRLAGGLDIPFTPLRRHLAWSAAPYPGDRPWAWWVDRPFYLRPDAGGTLLCPCDEGPAGLPERGRQPEADPAALETLAASARDLAPELGDCPVTRYWSGLRTYAPDRRFVLGRDPLNPRLFWVAGLGGHGMTSGLAVGRLVAEAILAGKSTGVLEPIRFSSH